MDDVRDDFTGQTPAVVIANKKELRSFKSSERINEEGDGPYHGFGSLSLFSDPVDLASWSQRQLL